jgi:hypothetical protein
MRAFESGSPLANQDKIRRPDHMALRPANATTLATKETLSSKLASLPHCQMIGAIVKSRTGDGWKKFGHDQN